jgi:hypothetical protein
MELGRGNKKCTVMRMIKTVLAEDHECGCQRTKSHIMSGEKAK